MRLEGPNDSIGFRSMLRFTRHWIHYGWLTLITVCCLAAAIQGGLRP